MKNVPSRILIADDDAGIRSAVQATLEAEGYEVACAEDGRKAIEAILNQSFDLAILDLSMPFLDGLEVLKELRLVRSKDYLPPILILTAHGSVTAAVESARRGAVDFLHKPISPETLRMAVRRGIEGLSAHPLVGPEDNYFG
jgi:DNA-binding response OmpR family regulator